MENTIIPSEISIGLAVGSRKPKNYIFISFVLVTEQFASI
jgi:hypothetical protein